MQSSRSEILIQTLPKPYKTSGPLWISYGSNPAHELCVWDIIKGV